MNDEQKTKVESIVFKKLIEHLQNRTDVQNIDLMNLSGFCRNCLSRWYSEAAEETGLKIDKDHAREIVYGMPHSVWKEKYQTDANDDQKANFFYLLGVSYANLKKWPQAYKTLDQALAVKPGFPPAQQLKVDIGNHLSKATKDIH